MSKILLVYASKTGTTQDAMTEVAKLISMPCDIYNCRNKLLIKDDMTQGNMAPGQLDWESYGMIVIGSAMYMRSPLKEIKTFCESNQGKLRNKKLVLLTCGIETEEEDKAYLWKHLPEEVSQAILLYRHLGGEIRENRMNALSRFAMREYVKKNGPAKGINHALIKELSSEIIKLMN